MGVNVFEGKVVGGEERVGIVCARFNWKMSMIRHSQPVFLDRDTL